MGGNGVVIGGAIGGCVVVVAPVVVGGSQSWLRKGVLLRVLIVETWDTRNVWISDGWLLCSLEASCTLDSVPVV